MSISLLSIGILSIDENYLESVHIRTDVIKIINSGE